MNARVFSAALVLVGAAFQFPADMKLGAADALISAATYRGFFPPENGLRWSAARSTIVFPEPGPGVPVRVELLLSGWRPAGVEAPRVVVTAGGRSVTAQPGPGAEVVSLETTTSGWWRSDLEVEVWSDVFDPGQGDVRRLGVRVEEARLVPRSRGLRFPPLGAVLGTMFSGLLIGFILGQAGSSRLVAGRFALGFVVLMAAAFALARPWAGLAWVPLFLSLLGLAGLARVAPRATWSAGSIIAASVRALVTGLGRLKDPHAATLIVSGVVLLCVAYRMPSRIDIDLGSGREAPVARDFGSFVGRAGVTARWAPRGAHLDLSDFGGGAPWKIEVVAAVDGAPRDVAVLGADAREIHASLDAAKWTTSATSWPSPFGWRSGLILNVPGGSESLRIDRVSIERGAALPSIRVAALALLGALMVLVGAGVLGLSPMVGRMGGMILLIGSSVAVSSEPLATIPFAPRFTAIVSMALVLAALLKGTVTFLDDGKRVLPDAVALGASVAGWIAWLTATAFPFYRGGHFVFHSSIAEEIWKGRFLIYYLPFPGSMLSEQAQWGKIVMPHPALYQTLVSPLAALPKPWFYFAEKAVLALFFASIVLVASVVARRVWGARGSGFAAILFAGLVPGFQLLGLGHLMTILGVWASSLALAWLIFKVDELGRFKTWLSTAWIFTFCFLSYTASLLFTGAVLVYVILASARTNPPRARSVFTMLVTACAFAFFLYYVHWTAPFLMQSVPKILGGAGLGSSADATPILARLALGPGKLTYSYGSMLIPLAGASGLILLPKSWDRLVLGAWMGILFFVSAMDVFFNFLLKHHYYVMLPVAVGLAGLLTRVETRWGRIPAAAVTALLLIPGLKTAIDVALGRIP